MPKKSSTRRLKMPTSAWELQAAQARFSELFRRTRSEGPQLIIRNGSAGVIMLPVEQFAELIAQSNEPRSLLQFFRESPLVGLNLSFERDKD